MSNREQYMNINFIKDCKCFNKEAEGVEYLCLTPGRFIFHDGFIYRACLGVLPSNDPLFLNRKCEIIDTPLFSKEPLLDSENEDFERCREQHYRNLPLCSIERHPDGKIKTLRCFELTWHTRLRWNENPSLPAEKIKITRLKIFEFPLNERRDLRKGEIFSYYNDNRSLRKNPSESENNSYLLHIFFFVLIFIMSTLLSINIYRKIKNSNRVNKHNNKTTPKTK